MKYKKRIPVAELALMLLFLSLPVLLISNYLEESADRRAAVVGAGEPLRVEIDWVQEGDLQSSIDALWYSDDLRIIFAQKIQAGKNQLLRSIDSGTSFEAVGLPSEEKLLDIIFDPKSERIIYASTKSGVYKSPDLGAKWNQISELVEAIKLGKDPISGYLYAFAPDGFYRSVDSGARWQRTFEANSAGFQLFNTTFTVDRGRSVLYVWGTDSNQQTQIYRSTDYGTSWRASVRANGSPSLDASATGGVYVDTVDTPGSILYSASYGDEWASIDTVPLSYGGGVVPSVLKHGSLIVVHAKGSQEFLMSTNGGGLWRLGRLPTSDASPLGYNPRAKRLVVVSENGSIYSTSIATVRVSTKPGINTESEPVPEEVSVPIDTSSGVTSVAVPTAEVSTVPVQVARQRIGAVTLNVTYGSSLTATSSTANIYIGRIEMQVQSCSSPDSCSGRALDINALPVKIEFGNGGDGGDIWGYRVLSVTKYGPRGFAFDTSRVGQVFKRVGSIVDLPLFSTSVTPVVFVPGSYGSSLGTSEDDEIWPSVCRTVASVNSDLLRLAYNEDYTPVDQSIKSLDVFRHPKCLVNALGSDYSSALIKEFASRGYLEGGSLFLFPYDWRDGISDANVASLASFIGGIGSLGAVQQGVIDGRNVKKVSIVAHSTGGLLAKRYVQTYLSGSKTLIDTLVYLGTPHLGTPKFTYVLGTGELGLIAIDLTNTLKMRTLASNFPLIYDFAPSEPGYDQNAEPGSVIPKVSARSGSDCVDKTSLRLGKTILDDCKYYTKLSYEGFHNLLTDESTSIKGQPALFEQAAVRHDGLDTFGVVDAGVDRAYSVIGCGLPTAHRIDINTSADKTKTAMIVSGLNSGDGTTPLSSALNDGLREENRFYISGVEHGDLAVNSATRGLIAELVTVGAPSTLPRGVSRGSSAPCVLDGSLIRLIAGSFVVRLPGQEGGEDFPVGSYVEKDLEQKTVFLVGQNDSFVVTPKEDTKGGMIKVDTYAGNRVINTIEYQNINGKAGVAIDLSSKSTTSLGFTSRTDIKMYLFIATAMVLVAIVGIVVVVVARRHRGAVPISEA